MTVSKPTPKKGKVPTKRAAEAVKGSKQTKTKKAPAEAPKPSKAQASRVAPPSAAKSVRKAPRAAEKTQPPAETSDPGMQKAQTLGAFGATFGWAAEIKTLAPGEVMATYKRGEEAIEFNWSNGVAGAVHYHCMGRSVGVRNASDTRKLMAVSPAEAEESAKTVIQRVSSRKEPRAKRAPGEKPEQRVLRRRVPWPEGATDVEIIDAVKGHRIVWRNSISGGYDEGYVARDGESSHGNKIMFRNHHLHIDENADGKRRLNWASPDGGFRSIYLDAIVQVRR